MSGSEDPWQEIMNPEDAMISRLLAFLDASPSPYHAVSNLAARLKEFGYAGLDESQSWAKTLQPGGRYYFTRNGSAMVAFAVGHKYKAGNGIKMVAAHTDSPCLKVKPVSKRRPKDNFLQVAVETYGGGLWNTWFDRDLGLAGRITLLDEKTGGLKERLVNICQPVLRIPTLAIHLDRSVKDGFSFNTELQLNPVLATRSTDNQQASAGSEEDEKASHHRALLSLLQPDSKSGVASDTIISSDLCLYDIQKAALGGAYQEFVLSARLDNLMLSFCTAEAFAQATANLEEEEHIRMAIWFDNEEVGSESAHGAMSTLVSSAVDRIAQALGHQATMHEMLAKSMLVSADMAHAVHPNYADKHDECHRPEMHAGVVIKYNSNQRYATSSRSAAIIKAIAHAQSIPIQEFMVRNDSPCGSTIGPIVSAKLGIMTIDVGLPQLSMHSIREMAGTRDVDLGIRLLKAFYETKSLEITTSTA